MNPNVTGFYIEKSAYQTSSRVEQLSNVSPTLNHATNSLPTRGMELKSEYSYSFQILAIFSTQSEAWWLFPSP